MEPWYKFILYGNYDGFSRSTLGDDNLYLVLENGEKVEVPRCFVKKASDFIEKDKLKLKDVIARIKKLDLDTQKVWLNEILNELGSDYGTLKYKDGYEQGKLEGQWGYQQLKDSDKIRQELNKPTVPQIVADYIKYTKEADWDLLEAINGIIYEDCDELIKWFGKDNNMEVFARAWLDGYEIKQEKRYLVKMKGVAGYGRYLNKALSSEEYFLASENEVDGYKTKHTRKELENSGFGWVFDCPGVEVKEVK